MSENNQPVDRYTSFFGINCDLNADRLISMLNKNLSNDLGEKQWQTYFRQKRQQQVKLQQDNLNFIGNQTNTLYEYFMLCDDQAALALLYEIEQTCC